MDARTIIQKLGGPSAAARFFECKPAAVSQWKRDNRIPNARLLHLKAACPDLFDQPQTGDNFGGLGEPRTGLERREEDRRQKPDPGFGDFGEPRDGDRRQEYRRHGDCEKEVST